MAKGSAWRGWRSRFACSRPPGWQLPRPPPRVCQYLWSCSTGSLCRRPPPLAPRRSTQSHSLPREGDVRHLPLCAPRAQISKPPAQRRRSRGHRLRHVNRDLTLHIIVRHGCWSPRGRWERCRRAQIGVGAVMCGLWEAGEQCEQMARRCARPEASCCMVRETRRVNASRLFPWGWPQMGSRTEVKTAAETIHRKLPGSRRPRSYRFSANPLVAASRRPAHGRVVSSQLSVPDLTRCSGHGDESGLQGAPAQRVGGDTARHACGALSLGAGRGAADAARSVQLVGSHAPQWPPPPCGSSRAHTTVPLSLSPHCVQQCDTLLAGVKEAQQHNEATGCALPRLAACPAQLFAPHEPTRPAAAAPHHPRRPPTCLPALPPPTHVFTHGSSLPPPPAPPRPPARPAAAGTRSLRRAPRSCRAWCAARAARCAAATWRGGCTRATRGTQSTMTRCAARPAAGLAAWRLVCGRGASCRMGHVQFDDRVCCRPLCRPRSPGAGGLCSCLMRLPAMSIAAANERGPKGLSPRPTCAMQSARRAQRPSPRPVQSPQPHAPPLPLPPPALPPRARRTRRL